MIDRVVGNAPSTIPIERFTRVGVHVEPGEVAAGDVESNSVTPAEHERCRIHFDREFGRLAGTSIFAVASDSRYRPRTMLSPMLRSTPAGKSRLGGYTSINFAVKSVSTAFELAHSFTTSLPVTSTSRSRGGVWNTTTSCLAERGNVSLHIQCPA